MWDTLLERHHHHHDHEHHHHHYDQPIDHDERHHHHHHQPAGVRITKRAANRLLCRPNPNSPLLRGLQDDVLVQNVGDHAWNGDIVGPWKNNFDNLDIIVTAKTIGNTEVILDKNIQPF